MQRNTQKTDRRVQLLIGIALVAVAAVPWIGSNAAAQGQTGAANSRPFTQGDELVQLDFKDVELPVVIETIARITGRNFIYDDRVRGRVTIVSPSEVTADQAYAVFESVLKIKGFTAVPGPGGVLKIVPIRDAKESSIETIRDNRPSPNRDSFVTRLVPLLYINAEAITNTIKPLVSKDASMVAYAPTNTIIMTDTEANIRRLLSILEAIDVETYREELAVIKVKHADAATLGEQVSEIYGAEVSSSAANPPSRARSARNRRNSQPAANTANVSPGQKVRIITDERTNSLLVLASRGAIQDIRDLVRQLDVPLIGGGRIHVYYLKHADAEELGETLNGMLSGQSGGARSGPGRTGATGAAPQNLNTRVTALAEGITINHDAATNSLVIQASKEAYEALAAVIKKLDIARPQVLVEAMILEVDVTDGIDLGVEWTINAINGDQQFFFSTASAAASGGGAGQIAGVVKRVFDVGADGIQPTDRASASGTNFDAVLKAAATDANLNLVSAPHILTSDNEEAEIRIGDNIPIITSRVESATGNTAGLASSVNVERQDIGVTLRVTPQISEGDSLRLKIFQELTAINEALQQDVGSAGQVGVALSSRKVENTVVVKDSETVVVGGLINDQWDDNENKVPFLGDIPGLGWAFKSTSKKLRKINLIVFLTPHIIRSTDEMELETIKRRRDFEGNSGARYTDDQRAESDEFDSGDYVWTSGKGPVRSRLRELSDRYSLERKEELEEILRDRDQQRIADRLDQGRSQPRSYALRVAIFTNESTAAAKLTKLIDAGFDGTISSDNTDGGLLYELIVGPFDDLAAAEETSKALREVYDYDPTLILMNQQTVPGEETSP
ncbi:MAG: type II secretion system secretin GspD [Myxococcota bacterium]|nr:type II secretion system secretin GspD [Myxococcota bacterium]